MRMIIYDELLVFPDLLVDSQDDAHLIYEAGNTSGYPPCDKYSLCYQSTSFEANTYDLSLPDLGTDVTHLSWDPYILRWNFSVVITGDGFQRRLVHLHCDNRQGKRCDQRHDIPGYRYRRCLYPFDLTVQILQVQRQSGYAFFSPARL